MGYTFHLVKSLFRNSRQHCLQSEKNNLKIQQEGFVLDVVKVVFSLYLILCKGCRMQIVDLRPAGQPWLYPVPVGIVRNAFFPSGMVADHLRTRPHQRHGAVEHIQQLGDFIQPDPAEQPSDWSYPLVNLTVGVFQFLDLKGFIYLKDLTTLIDRSFLIMLQAPELVK